VTRTLRPELVDDLRARRRLVAQHTATGPARRRTQSFGWGRKTQVGAKRQKEQEEQAHLGEQVPEAVALIYGGTPMGWFDGVKLGGTGIPNIFKAGTFYQDGGLVFWDVHHQEKTIVLPPTKSCDV
jgi:hypothetical protein